MESKNLKGLFNLVRKEFKDVRKEIRDIRSCVESLTKLVEDLGERKGSFGLLGEENETLCFMRRSEASSKGNTLVSESLFEQGGDFNALGEQESVVFRTLVRDLASDSKVVIGRESEADVRTDQEPADYGIYAPESGDGDISTEPRGCVPFKNCVHTTSAGEHTSTTSMGKHTSAELSEQIEEARGQNRDTSEPTRSLATTLEYCNAQVENRLDEMSLQIERVAECQSEIKAVLQDLRDRKAGKVHMPSVVPPPRKVGRNVVGFVYENLDGGGDGLE